MRLSLVGQAATATDIAGDGIAASPNDIALIADRLRAELTARGNSRRSSVVRRVVRTTAPVAALDSKIVADVCAQLERAGDFQEAPGGVLFTTPLRVVDIGASQCRIVCSMPTRWLPLEPFEDCECAGVIRRCQIKQAMEGEWRSAIAATGAVVISAETWAGFERTPKADGSWLTWLDARLQQPEPPGSLERQGALAWSGLVSVEGEPRWRAGEKAAQARLWHARSAWGYWVHAWTDGGPPSTQPFVQLRGDEGARTVFAVARQSGEPARLQIERGETAATFTITQWLPYAEYRFLSAYASASDVSPDGKRWTISRERVEVATEALVNRLGLVVVESPVV